ncbi:MAG: hypothetical protein M3Z65_00705 [Chloroflexota bacterium]|nr:hypothetical protein [Chloroflexota bacterium]
MADDPRRGDLLKTERARRIHEGLLVLGEALAAFYLRVLDELDAEPSRAAARKVVFHAWRELEGGIRDVLAPLVPAGSDEGSHGKGITAVITALGIALDDPAARTWFGLVGVLHKGAHRSGAHERGAIDGDLRADWDAFEDVLDRVLARFQEVYLAAIASLPGLIATTTPSESDVSALLWLPQPALNAFFKDVEAEGWLAPLVAKGYFARPIGRAYGADRGFALPYWQPAGYLQRLAQRRSERLQHTVMEVVLATEETDNDIAHVTFAEISLLAPPLMVAAWTERETDWLTRQAWIHPLLGERLAQLAAAVLDAGAVASGRALAAALLEPLPDPRFDGTKPEMILLSKEPRTRLGEDFDYERVLKIVRPALRRALGRDAVTFTADLLERAIELSHHTDGPEGRDDLSTWWRPTIEDIDQTHRTGLRQALVEELRDTAMELAAGDPESIPELVAALEARGLAIFDRVALHILRVVSAAPAALVAAHVADPGSRRLASWHEWAALTRDRFGDLSQDEQHAMIESFFAGPDDERIRARVEQIEGQAPTDAEVEARIDFERMRLLQLVADHLPAEARTRYEVLRGKRGEVKRPDLLHYSERLAPPPTPLEARSLGSDVQGWIEFARNFDPAPQLGEDGHETASRLLSAAVQADPAVFAAAAARFADLRPPYVRAIFSGLEDAARAAATFGWSDVLALAEWVLVQPVVTQPEHRFEEIGWTYTYHAIAWLLRSALADGPLQLPLEERARVWRVISTLAENPEPSPAEEAHGHGQPPQLQSFALTATRPRAIALAIDYGRWLDRCVPRLDDAAVRSLAAVPEVAGLLEDHLDPSRDPSAAVRSVYGERLGTLLFLDRAWVEAHRGAIFTEDPARAALRDAAWESYLDGNNVSRVGYDVLRAEYTVASERIGAPARYAWTTPPGVTLLHHLFVLHVVGTVGPAGLIEGALERAPAEIRHGAFEMLGRSLRQWVPDATVAARLQAIFKGRVEVASLAVDRAPYAGELATIGLWFDAPPGIDEAWLARTVARVLALVGRVEAPHWVTRKLAAAASRIPAEALDALDALVTAFRTDAWRLGSWLNEIRMVVSAGHAAGGPLRERALAVANRLALLGFSDDMRALLAELAAEAVDALEDAVTSDVTSN